MYIQEISIDIKTNINKDEIIDESGLVIKLKTILKLRMVFLLVSLKSRI